MSDAEDTSTSPVLACPACEQPMPRIVEEWVVPALDDIDHFLLDPPETEGEILVSDRWTCPNTPCHYRCAQPRRPGDDMKWPTDWAQGTICLGGPHTMGDPGCDCSTAPLREYS